MDVSVFIELAYGITLLLLGGLTAATLLRALAVKRELRRHTSA